MALITVTAKKDFYDRKNGIMRKKGDSFQLKPGTAQTYAGVDYINVDAEGKKEIEKLNASRVEAAAPVKKETASKPSGSDMSMEKNVTSEAPAKASAATAPAKT